MEEEKYPEIVIQDEEKRSEEVQTIIERMPVRQSLSIAMITIIVVLVIILLGFIVQYPDTVDGEISLTASNAPVRIVTHSQGRLRLLKHDKTTLTKGDIIGFIENGAEYKDVMLIDSLLLADSIENQQIVYPKTLSLGEIGGSYNDFLRVYEQNTLLIESNLFHVKQMNIIEQAKSDSLILEILNVQIATKTHTLAIQKEQFIKDSSIFAVKAITESQLNDRRNTYLTFLESYQNLLANKTSTESRINKAKIDLIQLAEEQKEKEDQFKIELISRRNNLRNTLSIWKERYLFIATISGKLEYLGFWRDNTYLNIEQEVFSIIPQKNEIIGEVVIPTVGSGNVEKGQTVNVKLNNFPYDEYGVLSGKVTEISDITHKIPTKEGSMDVYLVRVDFPNGLVTNYNKILDITLETKGIAEIITKPRRLIQRLFDNLKSKTVK